MSETSAEVRLELFVRDLDRSVAFYTEVLGFGVGQSEPGGYTALSFGAARIGLNALAGMPADHPVQAGDGERLGRGVEIVLVVPDVSAAAAAVEASGGPISAPLQTRFWGATDLGVIDLDGYYVRLTNGPG